MVYSTFSSLISLILLIFKFHFSWVFWILPTLPQNYAQSNSFVPICNQRISDISKCLLVSTKALNWEEAHSYCRGEGGFLPSEGDLNALTDLQYEGIWTALTYTENHYQWRSRNTALAGDTLQGKDWTTSVLWNSSCLVYDVKQKKFTPSGCKEEKQFVCILNRRLESNSGGHQNGPRVSANISPNELGWIEVSRLEFDDLKLECSANGNSNVNWKKDGTSIPYHDSTLQPSKIPHFKEPIFLGALSPFNSSRALTTTRQGTYCCETWVPFSTKVKRSNCVLVTLKNVTVEGASALSTSNICPKGYMIIGDRLCTKITRNVTWDEGFSQLYATGNERTIFDGADYLNPTQGVKNMSYHRLLLGYLKDSEVTSVRLLIKRKYPITPYIDHTIRYSYDRTYLTNAQKNFVKMDWVKNHPQADKECATLNVETGFLTSNECEERDNFITFVDLAELLTNSSFLHNDTRLCPEGWNRVILSERKQICVKYFRDQFFKSKIDSEAFCTSHGAKLANPCRGFMFWILRGFLKENEKIWINPTLKTCDWFPGNYFNHRSVLSHEGLESNDGKREASYSVICEKKIAKYSLVKLSLMKKPALRKHGNYSNPICLRAKPFPLIGNLSLTCLKNGAVIQPNYTKSNKCVCIIDMDEQGFYECSLWSNFPLIKMWSPVFFNKDETRVSYVVIGSERRLTYTPIYYDSTFYQIGHRKKFEPECMNHIFKLINNSTELIDNNFSNVYFSQKNGTFQYSFHMQCREPFLHMCSSKEEVKMGLKQAIDGDPTASKICAIVEVKTVLGCPEEKAYSKEHLLTWPATDGAGIFLPKEYCVLCDGQPISRVCDGSFMTGFYWRPPPTAGCPMKPTKDSTNLWKIRYDSNSSFSAIEQLTYKSKFLNAADLVNVAYAMQSRVKAYSKLSFDEVVSTMNNIMGSNESVFKQVSENFYALSMALKSFETLAFFATEDANEMTSIEHRLAASVYNVSLTTALTGFQWAHSNYQPILNDTTVDLSLVDAAIKFPENLPSVALNSTFEEYDSQLLFALYNNTNVFLDRETISSGYHINSHVIQSTFRRVEVNKYLLGDDRFITLYFRPTRNGSDMKCVFWNFRLNDNKGGWSSKGCHLVELKEGLVTCNCSHLTSFAILIKGLPDHGKHESALSLLSIIGCTFSVIGLMCVLLTFALFKKFRNSLSNKILANLSFSILMSLTIFLAGIKETQNQIICECVAVLLTYFILSSFGWMMIEAIHNYQKFVKVYGVYIPNFIWKASAFAWGMPLLPIGLLYAVNGSMRDYEIDDSICWMSTNIFLYTFVPYVAVVLVINVIIYILIIYSTILRRVNLTSTLNKRTLIKRQTCMATCVFFLLGLTWIFGFLSYIKEAIVFAYLFCICNTLQGFAIFFFHILRNREAKELWISYTKAIRLTRLMRLPEFSRTDENESTTNNNIYRKKTDAETSFSDSVDPTATSSTGFAEN